MEYYRIPTENEFSLLRNKWLEGPGKDSYLKLYAKLMNNFKETSCEITAEVLKWFFEGERNWVYLDNKTTFDEVYKKYNIFQVIFGDEIANIEHTMLIVNNKIIQSYFMKYSYSIRDLTNEDICTLSDVTNKENYKKLTGAYLNNNDFNLLFCVPV